MTRSATRSRITTEAIIRSLGTATAGLLTAGVAVPGIVVVGGVVILSIGFEHIIREISGYRD